MKFYLLSGILGGLLCGCDLVDPPQNIPSYIQVDSFSFKTVDSTGFNTQKITDVWIFVNGEQIGTYTVPTQAIPVLAEGNAEISILAGVYADGIIANRVYYPFYSEFKEKRNFEKAKVVKVLPKFTYGSRLKKPFIFYQDFELKDSGIAKGIDGNIDLKLIDHPANESIEAFGRKFGSIATTGNLDFIEITNEIWVPLNESGMPIYLEFDYKTTCEIVVGIYGQKVGAYSKRVSDLVLKPTDKWTKIYVNLTDEVGGLRPDRKLQYRFFMRSTKQPGAGNSLSLDNIRLINYPE